MTETHGQGDGSGSGEAEGKDKNLQLKATPTYQKAVLALAHANGKESISEYLQFLLDRELAAAQEELEALDKQIDQRFAEEAEKQKAELRKSIFPVVGKTG